MLCCDFESEELKISVKLLNIISKLKYGDSETACRILGKIPGSRASLAFSGKTNAVKLQRTERNVCTMSKPIKLKFSKGRKKDVWTTTLKALKLNWKLGSGVAQKPTNNAVKQERINQNYCIAVFNLHMASPIVRLRRIKPTNMSNYQRIPLFMALT